METSFVWLTLAALAVWRITHLLIVEDGPAGVITHLRSAIRTDWWRALWKCFYCMSLCVALVFAIAFSASWFGRVMIWFALSGAACLLERVGERISAPPVYFEGAMEEEAHGLLRRRTAGNDEAPTRSRIGPNDGD